MIQVDKLGVLRRERTEAIGLLASHALILVLCILDLSLVAAVVAGVWAAFWILKVMAVTADLHQHELD